MPNFLTIQIQEFRNLSFVCVCSKDHFLVLGCSTEYVCAILSDGGVGGVETSFSEQTPFKIQIINYNFDSS